jgi:hypothetical protein
MTNLLEYEELSEVPIITGEWESQGWAWCFGEPDVIEWLLFFSRLDGRGEVWDSRDLDTCERFLQLSHETGRHISEVMAEKWAEASLKALQGVN